MHASPFSLICILQCSIDYGNAAFTLEVTLTQIYNIRVRRGSKHSLMRKNISVYPRIMPLGKQTEGGRGIWWTGREIRDCGFK